MGKRKNMTGMAPKKKKRTNTKRPRIKPRNLFSDEPKAPRVKLTDEQKKERRRAAARRRYYLKNSSPEQIARREVRAARKRAREGRTVKQHKAVKRQDRLARQMGLTIF